MSTDSPDPKTVPISARVAPEDRDAIDALRPLYPEPDGEDASRSSVLRAFFALAMPALGDLGMHRRLQQLAKRLRRSVGEVLRDVIAHGLEAMEEGR